jgi:hypothetical protein
LSTAEREASAVRRARRLAEVDAFFDGLVDEMLASWERRITQAGARDLLKLATSLRAEAVDLRTAHEARGLQLARPERASSNSPTLIPECRLTLRPS